MKNIYAEIGEKGLTDLGYRFFDKEGELLDSRITSGIVELPGELGVYLKDAPSVPAKSIGVVWDRDGQTTAAAIEVFDLIETDVTLLDALEVLLATLGGLATGGGTSEIVFKNPAGDTTRATMTVDSNGNRSAVTLNV